MTALIHDHAYGACDNAAEQHGTCTKRFDVRIWYYAPFYHLYQAVAERRLNEGTDATFDLQIMQASGSKRTLVAIAPHEAPADYVKVPFIHIYVHEHEAMELELPEDQAPHRYSRSR